MSETGAVTNWVGANGSVTDTLIAGRPSELLDFWVYNNNADPTVLPITISVYDEAATTDITGGSRVLYRTILDTTQNVNGLANNFSIQATKGICVRVTDIGTNEFSGGLTTR